ncbi:Brp/Blh family beta-carotene 15,15'-dioxygenase [Halobellus rarus]|uniref:Probable beta-carotene 15,15'-dioxygenase n=1 Tax=Halobellus rarus TaxID=1126237 RepID=A0ABD6CK52_9EURY|nr:Brp/Blh family beta-carotene 15,15'-dioxygenase [Halobellus rarus]
MDEPTGHGENGSVGRGESMPSRAVETPGSRGSIAASVMRRVGVRPAWVVIGGITLVWAIATAFTGSQTLPRWLRYGPLAVSLAVFGLPHGAVDHLAPARAAGRRPTAASILAVGVLYLVLGSAYGLLWWALPVASAALFVALTWFHWGQGDVYALDAIGASHLDGRGVRVGTLLVRGGLPMLVPLLAHPAEYRVVVGAWVALFGSELDAAWLLSPTVRGTLGGGFALLTVATLLAGRRRSGGRVWYLDAGETALLWGFFLLVPPLFAVGVYFCVWHSLRHIARLIAVDPTARTTFAERGPVPALMRVGRDALPLTAVAVLLLLAIAVAGDVALPGGVVAADVAVGTQTDLRAAAALYLVFISVLTLPHVAIVTWMDWAENAGLARLVDEQ